MEQLHPLIDPTSVIKNTHEHYLCTLININQGSIVSNAELVAVLSLEVLQIMKGLVFKKFEFVPDTHSEICFTFVKKLADFGMELYLIAHSRST